MTEKMSNDLNRTIETLDSIQNARDHLLQACAEFETSILINCSDTQYDQLFEDYEQMIGAMSHLLDLSTDTMRKAMQQAEAVTA